MLSVHAVESEGQKNLGGFEDLEVTGVITIHNSRPGSRPSSPNLDLRRLC